MRPIIGVNGDCLWLCGDVCHSPSSLSAPRSHGKLTRRLTGTGVGSNFRFVRELELKPALVSQLCPRDQHRQLALSQSFAQCFPKFGLRQVARNAREIWVRP